MPGKKKSNARHSNEMTPIGKKNDSFFKDYLSDIKTDGEVADVYVGRVIARLGNGRMNVFYVQKNGNTNIVNAPIRGLFKGKGKHSVPIETNSLVLIADSGIPGSAQYEIVCGLSSDHIRDLRRATAVDPRLTAYECTDGEELMKDAELMIDGGFTIGEEDTEYKDEDDEKEIDVDAI